MLLFFYQKKLDDVVSKTDLEKIFGNRLVEIDIDNNKITAVVGSETSLDKFGKEQIKAIVDVRLSDFITKNLDEKVGNLTYAYTLAYIECKDKDLKLDKAQYKELVKKLTEAKQNEGFWSWIQERYYEPKVESLGTDIKNCDDAIALRQNISDALTELKESVDSFEEIVTLINRISDKISNYTNLVTSKENVGCYQAGRLVIPVASTVVPIAGQAGKSSKISKTKIILKEVAELSETKTDDLVERLVEKGIEKGIVKRVDDLLVAFKAGYTKESILAIPKGSRPSPNVYLDSKYIANHLAKFEREGGAFVVVKSWIEGGGYNEFPIKKYAMLTSDMESVITKFRNSKNIEDIEKALGYNIGDLKGLENEIHVFYVDKTKFNFEMPSGNEIGANSLWEPGGFTSGGYREAVLIDKTNSANKIIHNKNIEELKKLFKWKKL